LFLSYSFLFSIRIKASSIDNSVGSFSSGIVAFNDLYLIYGPYLKCENKSARIENIEEIFSIGLNRAVTLIAEAKPGRMSSSLIKDLGEHPEDKKPVRIMKGQYGPYIKYKSLNATIPEEKDPTELTMEEALILIEKRKEYDKTKKKKMKKKK